MDGFGIEEEVETEGSDEWRDEIDDNFLETFVEYSRANQVANEAQATVALYGYVTGLLPNWEDYLGILIRGGTSSGKTWMKQNVLDEAFQYADREYGWLYTITSGSDQSLINDEEFDDARIGAFSEFQQMPSALIEFIKRVVEDGGYTYGRSQADEEAEGGFKMEKFSRDPMPIIFALADENETSVGAEMQSRMVNVQVDEGPAKNEAVHKMKHGHTNIELPDSKHEYVREAPDLNHAVKKHLKNIPTDTDVVIPTGDGRFEKDDWDESEVTKPLFNFARSESTRASKALASMVKASALLNYHSRDRITDETDGEEYIVAEPQDVGNVLAARSVLLATTHNLTRKKFIVLEAFIEDGAPASGLDGASESARQIGKQGVINYIQRREDIPTFSKSVVTDILDELDEDLVINKRDHPEDARKNIYVYDPSTQFERPNIYDYYEKFEDVVDPITGDPIERTIEKQLEDVNAMMSTDDMAERAQSRDDGEGPKSDSGGLDEFAGDSEPDIELSELEETVAAMIHETLDGKWAPARVRESNTLKVTHMLGLSPVENRVGDNADGEGVPMVIPEREPKYEDRQGTIASPEDDMWGEDIDVSDVDSALNDAVASLIDSGIVDVEIDDVGNARFSVMEVTSL